MAVTPTPVRKASVHSHTVPASARNAYLLRVYGITEAQYLEILESQGGRCAICGRKPAAGKNLHVDHDHRTGAVRGLLDVRCNHELLGRLGDKDPGLFRRAAEYLETPPASAVLPAGHVVPTRPKRRRTRRKA